MKALIVHTSQQSSTALQQMIGAAEKLCEHIDLLLIGASTEEIFGIQTIYHYPQLEQSNAPTISALIQQHDEAYTYVLTHADTTGKDFLPYYCGRTHQPMLSDISEIIDQQNFTRAIYAGAIREQVTHQGEKIIMSIRGVYFDQTQSKHVPKIETLTHKDPIALPAHIESKRSGDSVDLSTAEIVISGGRGLNSKENFEKIHTLAKQCGAAVGASRAAVDAGYITNEHQVGQTGKIIAPRLYICFGISGAVQHLSGMKDAKTIIAIDKNPDAPIFSVADYGYAGDLFEALAAFEGKIIL